MYMRYKHLGSLLVVAALLLIACTPEPVAPSDLPGAESAESAASESASTVIVEDAQQGGVFTLATSADATILNPILSSDTASSGIHGYLFPALIGVDPFTGAFSRQNFLLPFGGMATDWTVTEDGLTWTFTLRQNVTWSDGEPVDAHDFKFTYDAIASELVDTPRKSNVEFIESITVVDDFTLEIVLTEVKCDALSDLTLGWLPSHLYAEDFSDIMTSPLNVDPKVTAGPLAFQSWARDDNTILVRNSNYVEGAANMDGMIFRIVPDPGARLAQLQSGEVDYSSVQPEQITAVDNDSSLERFNFRDDGYNYIGLNLANPENPLPGRDEEGNLVEQDPHPILSEHAVRLAIAHALDYESIIKNVYLGQGYQIASNVLPAVKWAHDPSIQPYDFDPELAASILEEAGWVDSDGDGIREKDGATLSLTLMTNAGNTTREDLGVLVQDQLGNVGFEIDFQAIDFGTLVGALLGQTFDMVIIGWTGLGTDPNDRSFWHTEFDTPESGFNFVSYQNPEIDALLEQGIQTPGCAPEDRAPIYQQIQQIIHDDIPYVFVSGSVGNQAYNARWKNVDPGAWSFFWNMHQWYDANLQP